MEDLNIDDTVGRPRRSVLYLPGANERALKKAATVAADCLILDLEDAVAITEKETARQMVCDMVKTKPFGKREVIIRINGFDTEWGEADLRAACAAQPDAILIPKVNSAKVIEETEAYMLRFRASEDIKIWAMIETARGVLHVEDIAASSPRLGALVVGTNDLMKELFANHTPVRSALTTSLGMCMLAARAYGIACIDGVYNAYKDDEGLREMCNQGSDFGFDGKTLIHPAQIAICNEVFSPTKEDLDQARRYVEAFKAAEAEGRGVAVVDGQLVENLHVENAKRQLDMAALIEEMQKDL